MVLVDASRGGCRARSPRARASSNRSPTSSGAALSTLTTRGRRSSAAGGCPTCCSRATMANRRLAKGAGALRNPIDYLTEGLPHGWRITIDWLVTIVGAIAIVLAIKAWVVNPYRIPSSSMEPTLHCARPGSELRGALLRPRARLPLLLPLLDRPARRDRRLPHAALAQRAAAPGHLREAADRAAGRDVGGAARLRLHQRQAAQRAVHQARRAGTRARSRRSRSRPATTS